MSRVVLFTLGGPKPLAALPQGIAALTARADATLEAVSLYPCAPLAQSAVDTIVLAPAGPTRGRLGRIGRLLRRATFRNDRSRLWALARRDARALERLSDADIVWVDGHAAAYAAWRLARKAPKPWIVVGHGPVITLLANGYRVGR